MSNVIRQKLAELLGVANVSEEQMKAELDELKIDNKLKELTEAGHVAADLDTQVRARKLLKLAPEDAELLLRTPKPVPAQGVSTITPPAAPPGAGADPTETAIQEHMAKHNVGYSEAASAVAKGGTLVPGGNA